MGGAMNALKRFYIYGGMILGQWALGILCVFLTSDDRLWPLYAMLGYTVTISIVRVYGIYKWDRRCESLADAFNNARMDEDEIRRGMGWDK